jgi:two-component system, chemotaxis family, sensor kinase CheA
VIAFLKFTVLSPISKIASTAKRVSAGEKILVEGVNSKDEMGSLSNDFNLMARSLYDYQNNLEKKIEERTETILEREKSIRLMLDNSGDGFLTINPLGEIGEQKSRILTAWFGENSTDLKIWDYLFRNSSLKPSSVQVLIESLFEDPQFLDLNLSQLPRNFRCADKFFALEFVPLFIEGELKNLMLVVIDETERIKRDSLEKKNRELFSAMSRLILDRTGFSMYLRTTQSELSKLAALVEAKPHNYLKAAKVILHTIKGNSYVSQLHSFGDYCHEIESQMEKTETLNVETVLGILNQWKSWTSDFFKMIDQETETEVRISQSEWNEVLALSAQYNVNSELRRKIEVLGLEPAEVSLQRVLNVGQAVCKKLGVNNVNFCLKAKGIRFSKLSEQGEIFMETLSHIVRNAVDHGCETQNERTLNGKSEFATVSLSCELSETNLTLVFEDDGRGIDFGKLKAKAVKNGIISADETSLHVLQNLVFENGLSSRDAVNSISGRGVGMGAVRQVVLELGGSISAESEAGKGTKIKVAVPVSRVFMPTKQEFKTSNLAA